MTRPGAQADPVRPLRVPAVGPPPCPRRLHGGGGCAREPQLAQELLHVQEVRQGWQEPRRPPAPRKDDVNNASCLRVSNEELQSRVKREHERRNHMAKKKHGVVKQRRRQETHRARWWRCEQPMRRDRRPVSATHPRARRCWCHARPPRAGPASTPPPAPSSRSVRDFVIEFSKHTGQCWARSRHRSLVGSRPSSTTSTAPGGPHALQVLDDPRPRRVGGWELRG
jgi:hypothetical protein